MRKSQKKSMKNTIVTRERAVNISPRVNEWKRKRKPERWDCES